MSDQTVTVTIDGLNEVFSFESVGLFPLAIASNLENAVLFLVKRLMDDKYSYDFSREKTHGFSISDKQIGIISLHIIEPILAFSKQLFVRGHAGDFTISFLTCDISCSYQQVNISVALTQAVEEVA